MPAVCLDQHAGNEYADPDSTPQVPGLRALFQERGGSIIEKLETLRNDLAAATAAQKQLKQALERASQRLAAIELRDDVGGLVVDENTFSVEYRGRSCELGNGLLFRLLKRLLLRPGFYVGLSAIEADVWFEPGVSVAPGAVRGVVLRLRRKLKKAGMTRIANAIESGRGTCYRLSPERL